MGSDLFGGGDADAVSARKVKDRAGDFVCYDMHLIRLTDRNGRARLVNITVHRRLETDSCTVRLPLVSFCLGL